MFRYGESIISSPGKHCIAYSLLGTLSVLQAHGISKMVQYGKLVANEKTEIGIYIFPVDCIHGTISAVPFLVNESIVNAREWLICRAIEIVKKKQSPMSSSLPLPRSL